MRKLALQSVPEADYPYDDVGPAVHGHLLTAGVLWEVLQQFDFMTTFNPCPLNIKIRVGL